MALSVFEKKASIPGEEDILKALGTSYSLWKELTEFVLENGPDITKEWNFSGKNFGWSMRLQNPKKVIIYLTPCRDHFLASFVFGPAATEEAMRSSVSDKIKEIIDSAKVYAEGRGFRIPVTDVMVLEDLKKLVLIKLGIKHNQK
ncbi:MAG: DUF3788 domain-containing protein [Syntrophothermus sp.]